MLRGVIVIIIYQWALRAERRQERGEPRRESHVAKPTASEFRQINKTVPRWRAESRGSLYILEMITFRRDFDFFCVPLPAAQILNKPYTFSHRELTSERKIMWEVSQQK